MMKKTGIGFLVIVFAFFALGYVQKGKIERKLTALLQDNCIQVAQFHVNWLPSPSIDLTQAVYSTQDISLSAQQIRLNLNWWGLISGQSEIDVLHLEKGEVRSNSSGNFHQIYISIKPKNLKLASLPALLAQYRQGSVLPDITPELLINVTGLNEQEDSLTFEGTVNPISSGIRLNNVTATIQLKKRRLFNSERIAFSWKNGEILRLAQEGYYAVNLTNAAFNNVDLNDMNARIQTEPWINGVIKFPSISDKGWLSVNIESQSTRSARYHLMISGRHLALEDWLQAFDIPDLISGDMDVDADLFSSNTLPQRGLFSGQVSGGKLKGVELVSLISQYVPINYDETALNNKNNETSFDLFKMQFQWDPEGIRVDNIRLLHRYFTAKSQGYVDLTAGSCDFMTYISSNEERYRGLTLPVHFFGDCKSPQYKVKFNQNFRRQLKDFLREKFR